MNMQLDPHVRAAFDDIVARTPDIGPAPSPDLVPAPDRGGSPRTWIVAAAVIAATIGGLAMITTADDESIPAATPETEGAPPATPAAAVRFETPTVRLEADTLEVITPAGTFVPTADVVVTGDPGMPDEYTTLELTWHDGTEQRLLVYFTSDGATWWSDEIRVYDGAREWVEPYMTGRFFESPLGSAYGGDVDLPNLRITGLSLQAFVAPTACTTPSAPVALVVDYPTIAGWAPGGYGASFQVYDTATCTPLPIADYTFEYTTDDPAVAVIADTGPIAESRNDPTIVTVPGVTVPGGTPTNVPRPSPRRDFNDIKSRVDLTFPGPGSTTLHVTVRDAGGTVVGSADVPITVTEAIDDTAVDSSTDTATDLPAPPTSSVPAP